MKLRQALTIIPTCLIIAIPVLGTEEIGSAAPAPEVFQAFAGAWLEFQDGHYISAMRSFHDVALMDTRFSPAITGMKSAAERLKLPQVSDALSQYEAQVIAQSSEYGGFIRQFAPGVAFWGLYTEDDSYEFAEVSELEKTLLDSIRKTTSLEVSSISPVSYESSDREKIKAYSYNIMGLLGVDNGVVYLDLYLIRQYDINSTQVGGVGYATGQSLGYRKKRISLNEGEFPDFFASSEGAEFLQSMLTEGKVSVPKDFQPKHRPQSIDQFDPKQSTVFDLFATQANRSPSYELFAKFSPEGH